MLALRLPPDIEKRLTDLAAKSGRTKSYYAREAIVSYIEDFELLAEAERRMRDNPVFIPFEEVLANIGLTIDDLKDHPIPDVS
jgi:RHH-type transcriptional regulator, rel operon repressor / antitoxin RelB